MPGQTLVPPPEPEPAPSGDEGPFPPSPVDFRLPSTRLLHPLPPETAQDNSAEIAERSRIIEDTLAEFGLNGAVTHVVCGPTITRYEVKPESGVKVDRIQGVHSNLQMNLRAKSLRIIAPIPGKDVVGLEVPNIKSRPVPLRGIAESPEWKAAAAKMALPMLLSRDIDGQPVIVDLAKMPHMIVAGTTGSGKSVTLNGILAGWLLTRTPDQLRLVLVDPKRVEFTPYADIPHLVVPVITDAPKVAVCLQWAVKEMDRRLKLFQSVGVRNIAAFNTRTSSHQASLFGSGGDGEGDGAPATLPYIAIVIDEMSDLMMLAGADVEPRVVRLAQLARAVGIHLIIATQRPDVKVITGKIKANFPARIALKVASAMDSMTIIDQGGAQTLIGRGDMLFLNPTSSAGLQRSQSCWIDDDEISALTQWYRDQSEPLYVPDIKAKLDKIKVKDAGDSFKTFENDEAGGGGEGGGDDEGGGGGEEALLQRCLDVIVAADRASTSMLQRKLKLGYNKAARIMDELEQRGCIGPANGSAPRDILRTTLHDPSEGAGAPDDDGAAAGYDDGPEE
jgi:S-DNA-T family DNA segregation ATPase FtsK/SpoIIIE